VQYAEERLALQAKRARNAHPDLWSEGVSWYRIEAARLAGMALALGVPAGLLTAAAAALSPGNSWSVLLDRLPDFVHAVRAGEGNCKAWPPSFPTYTANRWKALRLVQGVSAPEAEVRGRKVRAFYEALTGDTYAVVLDRHSSRHALDKEALTAGEHRAAVEAFRRVAASLGVSPRDLQAALWTVDVGAGGDAGGARAKAGQRGLAEVQG